MTPTPIQAPPAAAEAVFGAALPQAIRYAELLAGAGVERGLIGPREVDRLWDRHLLNCSVLAPLLPPSGIVLDLGSGAGLPGIVLALLRPDLPVILVDATRRRIEFLDEVIAELGLERVSTRWSRAEELNGQIHVETVVARAVAPLEKLIPWAVALLTRTGQLLALKGERAESELKEAKPLLGRLALTGELVPCGDGVLTEPTMVVRIKRKALK
ncbi:MAG: rsmG [Frankiales bacterium]|nr:rsmG [Frankiales bacterium]